MRRAVLLLALSGCNAAFGLRETKEADAQQFDAPADAPYQCPPLGTAPRFSPQVHQLSEQDCSGYTASAQAGLAVAMCSDGVTTRIYQGPLDGPLTPILELPPYTLELTIGDPKLSPEGDLLLFATFDLTATVSAVRVYHRAADGTWLRDAQDLPVPQFGIAGTPSRGPDRHVLYASGSSDLTEWATHGGATWTKAPVTHALSTLGLKTAGASWLSPDGLRVVISGATTTSQIGNDVVYADRAAIGDPFGPGVTLPVPSNDAPFLTEDCSRIYMSSLHAIFYAFQR